MTIAKKAINNQAQRKYDGFDQSGLISLNLVTPVYFEDHDVINGCATGVEPNERIGALIHYKKVCINVAISVLNTTLIDTWRVIIIELKVLNSVYPAAGTDLQGLPKFFNQPYQPDLSHEFVVKADFNLRIKNLFIADTDDQKLQSYSSAAPMTAQKRIQFATSKKLQFDGPAATDIQGGVLYRVRFMPFAVGAWNTGTAKCSYRINSLIEFIDL